MRVRNRSLAYAVVLAFVASCLLPGAAVAHFAHLMAGPAHAADGLYDVGHQPSAQHCPGMAQQESELCQQLCSDGAELAPAAPSISTPAPAAIAVSAVAIDLTGSLAPRAPPAPPIAASPSGRDTYLRTLRLRL